MKKFAPALTAALILGATGASAHDYSTYGQTSHGHSTTSYTAPTVDLGPIEYVQPQSTTTTSYVAPATTSTYAPYQPSTSTYSYSTTPATTYTAAATTTYTAPVTSYTTTPSYTRPAYTAPAYTTPTYTAPTYTTPTYTTPAYSAPAYTTPIYSTPTYTVPRYVAPTVIAPTYGSRIAYAPRYDGRDNVRSRIQRQRDRIERAAARGDLRPREQNKLMNRMQDIRQTFRAYRKNDGVISRGEEAELLAMLDRQSQRIRRLANNDRVVRGHGGYSSYRAH